jgi:hypothetical protein
LLFLERGTVGNCSGAFHENFFLVVSFAIGSRNLEPTD